MAGNFGALPFVFGTLVSSLVALVLAVPLAVGVAVFVTELCPRFLRGIISFTVELLAAIPSVIYGLWGIFVLAPILRNYVQPWLSKYLGWTGFFDGPAYGIGMLAAGIILAIMIVPIIASITREVLVAVPQSQREAVLALGATRWEMVRMAVLRNARVGIMGGIILGLGRAIGETMAVTMLIGNRPGDRQVAVCARLYDGVGDCQRIFRSHRRSVPERAGGDRTGSADCDRGRECLRPPAGLVHHSRALCEVQCLASHVRSAFGAA